MAFLFRRPLALIALLVCCSFFEFDHLPSPTHPPRPRLESVFALPTKTRSPPALLEGPQTRSVANPIRNPRQRSRPPILRRDFAPPTTMTLRERGAGGDENELRLRASTSSLSLTFNRFAPLAPPLSTTTAATMTTTNTCWWLGPPPPRSFPLRPPCVSSVSRGRAGLVGRAGRDERCARAPFQPPPPIL